MDNAQKRLKHMNFQSLFKSGFKCVETNIKYLTYSEQKSLFWCCLIST